MGIYLYDNVNCITIHKDGLRILTSLGELSNNLIAITAALKCSVYIRFFRASILAYFSTT